MPKTSVYLPDELAAAVKASGVPMAELIRRGLAAESPCVAAGRTGAREAAEALLGEQRETIREAVRAALRDMQGGGF